MYSRKCKFETKNPADLTTNCLSGIMPKEKRKPTYNAEKNQFHRIYPSFIMKYSTQVQTVPK